MSTDTQNIDVDLQNHPQQHGLRYIEDTNRLREQEPVFWSDLSQTWIITRFQDVADGFYGKYPLISSGREEFVLSTVKPEQRAELIPNLDRYVRDWIVMTDAPRHTRMRKLVMAEFTKKRVEQMRPIARERVTELLDFAEKTQVLEFNEQIARPLPAYVLFKMLGLPSRHLSSLRDWSNAMVEGVTAATPSLELLQNSDWAMGEMNRVVLEELKKRETEPREDLLTRLLNATIDGDTLNLDELLATMHILIIAGHDTTSNTMTMGLEALGRHPEAWQYMYEHPDRILACVNELMRYVAMSSGQVRIASEDFTWRGKKIKQGELVFLSIQGANRDPEAFDHPEQLDFARDNTNSQVFGPGTHHCIGHLLAKMQLCEFFGELVKRFESVEILDRELAFMPVSVFRGLYAMNVRLHPRNAGA